MQIIKPDRKTLFVLMAMGLLLFVGWLAMRSPAQLASTATVARGPLEVVFQEEGKTRIKERYVVAAPVAGTVRRIMLQPGDAVLFKASRGMRFEELIEAIYEGWKIK